MTDNISKFFVDIISKYKTLCDRRIQHVCNKATILVIINIFIYYRIMHNR